MSNSYFKRCQLIDRYTCNSNQTIKPMNTDLHCLNSSWSEKSKIFGLPDHEKSRLISQKNNKITLFVLFSLLAQNESKVHI